MTASLNVFDQQRLDTPTVSSGPRPRPGTAVSLPPVAQDELGPQGRRLLTAGVIVAHVIGGWALLQVDAVRQAVIEMAPTMISVIERPAPSAKPAPPPPPPRAEVPTRVQPVPSPLIAAAPSPIPAPVAMVAPEPVPVPLPAPEPAPPVPVKSVAPVVPMVPTAPPVPAAPPAPKQIAPGSVRYLSEPRLSVPLLSRRLKESGTVVLRIVVDVHGRLKEAVVGTSSGFSRLDEQALQDIRTARFAPQTENGQPIEWQTLAPLVYEAN